MRRVSASDLSFADGRATDVISGAQKFVLPVPSFGPAGEPLTFPAGHELAGQAIRGYDGAPVGDRGIVFFNHKDRSWQAAAGDGNAVVIVNDVSGDQARQIDRIVRRISDRPDALTLPELKDVIDRVRGEVGLDDVYNSTRAFIAGNMCRVGEIGNGTPAYGLFRRDHRDVCQAVYIPGPFAFSGPAGSLQQFNDGGVVVLHEGEARGVQPDVFIRTYRLANGDAIQSLADDIASQ